MTSRILRSRRSIMTSNGGLWFAAIILSLGWHALWSNWLSVEHEAPAKRAVAQPRVVFLPIAKADEPPSVAQMPVSPRSPALFALPVLGSFSDPLLRQTISVRPPLAPRIATQFVLPESAPAAWNPERDAGDELWWMGEVASGARAFPLRIEDEPVFIPASVTDTIVTITFDGDLSELRWTRQDLPDFPEVCVTQSWEMIVFVAIGKNGRPKQVLLEKRSPSVLFDEALERKLRSQPLAGLEKESSGRLRIQVSLPNYWSLTDQKEAP